LIDTAMRVAPSPPPEDACIALSLRRSAISGTLTVTAVIAAAEQLIASGRAREAVELYQLWVDHNQIHELAYAVLFNLGVTLTGLGDDLAAAAAYRLALKLSPGFLAAAINLGSALERLGQPEDALQSWYGAATYPGPPNSNSIAWQVEAWKQSGRILELSQAEARAEAALTRCLELDPTQLEAAQHLIALRQTQCRWPVLIDTARLSKRDLLKMISPLSLAAYRDDAMFQLAAAHHYHLKHNVQEPATAGQWVRPDDAGSRRLRIGYLSSDLRAHAIGYLTAEVYALHDRNTIEIFLYYCGPVSEDALQQRIRGSADHWTDISKMTDRQAASCIVRDEIDILVDLNGYTKDARTKVVALRPAPIIVNWLGFPGSMGTPYHHYIIADEVIIPPESESFYSEKVLRLPCYQPNDRHREVDAAAPSRAAAGLPEDATVFCCFNGQNKITEQVFNAWIEILEAVPESVLWLLSTRAATSEDLKARAVGKGISAARIIFADRRWNAGHLARYPLADLFLDTFPYGAHTTASDALWMGVPVLTCTGQSFASRVCSSLLHAASMPDLVTNTLAEYKRAAITIGLDRHKQQDLKNRLRRSVRTSRLFDTPALVRHLEALYQDMWNDFLSGRLPSPDLRNLPHYHDIGSDVSDDWIGSASNLEKRAYYETQMAYRNGISPAVADSRAWRRAPEASLALAA
jgi:predicted O-linked N-acetylglucosamine transferase (SPINDLY family)